MPKEHDQTRWVGIRPTTDCGAIPVTESAPLTDILVAPSAGNPQFETLTKKRAPAISDLQAVKDVHSIAASANNVDASVSYLFNCPAVPAGELWVITNCSMIDKDSMCDMKLYHTTGGVRRILKAWNSIPDGCYMTWDGLIVMKEDDLIAGEFSYGGAIDDLIIYVRGYKIGVY